MPRSSRPLLCSLAVLLATSRGEAAAPADSFALSWVRLPGTETCVAPRPLAQLVESRLGRAVFTNAAQADVSIEGHVARQGGGYRVVLRLLDASGATLGQRELTGAEESCEALVEPLSLVLALLIDPNATIAPLAPRGVASIAPSPPPPVAPPASACPELPPPPAPPPAPPAAPSRPWSWEASAGGALAFGAVPSVAPGGMIRVQVRPAPGWGLELNAAAFGRTSAGDPDTGQVTIGMTLATLLGCPLVLERAAVDFAACAGVQVGQLNAQGQALDVDRQADRTLLDVAAQMRAGLGLVGPLRLTAGATAGALLRRDTFFYRDAAGARQDIFRPGPLALLFDLGLALRLP